MFFETSCFTQDHTSFPLSIQKAFSWVVGPKGAGNLWFLLNKERSLGKILAVWFCLSTASSLVSFFLSVVTAPSLL